MHPEPLQLVHTQARSEPLILDLRGNPEAGTVLDEHIRQRRFHRYSLQQPGLFLFAAFVREDGLDLVFSFHHAILDGWSVANLIVALVAAYRGERRRRAPRRRWPAMSARSWPRWLRRPPWGTGPGCWRARG
ncbi:condensation domain-containing protein [Pseudomonas aeruginosa]|nr:condensation domain-containing protein [Pseudomonas aeruginosa]